MVVSHIFHGCCSPLLSVYRALCHINADHVLTERSRNKHVGGEKSTNKCDVEKCVCVVQVGIVSYGENVTHNVNLSQFDNTPALLEFVDELPQETGLRTMTFQGIDTAR